MELRRFKVDSFLNVISTKQHYFTDEQIVEMLNRAEAIGFDLAAPNSPLEGLSLAELEILTRDAGQA